MSADIERDDIERQELDRSFHAVLSTAEGKRVVFWMLEQSAIYLDAFAAEDAATNYTLGRQAIGRRLIAKLDELDPRLYPRLLLDIADLKALDRAAASATANPSEDDEEAV